MSKKHPEDQNLSALHGSVTTSFNARREIAVDVERYQKLLDGTDLTDAQKREIIEALWLIVMSFVDLGFSVHPVQKACGKLAEDGSGGTDDGNAQAMMEPE